MYKNPTPVAVALIPVKVEQGYGLLIGRRTIAPEIGGFAFPGGYIDEMESAEEAVSREVLEETGFVLPIDQWTPIATRVTPQNRLLIFLLCKTTLLESEVSQFTPKPECDALSVASFYDTLCFSTHTEILQERRWTWNL